MRLFITTVEELLGERVPDEVKTLLLGVIETTIPRVEAV